MIQQDQEANSPTKQRALKSNSNKDKKTQPAILNGSKLEGRSRRNNKSHKTGNNKKCKPNKTLILNKLLRGLRNPNHQNQSVITD